MADFITQFLYPGIGGIDLRNEPIETSRLARMTNIIRTYQGELTGRPGLVPSFSLGDIYNRWQAMYKFQIPVDLGTGTTETLAIVDGAVFLSFDDGTAQQLFGGVLTDPVGIFSYQVPGGGTWAAAWSSTGFFKTPIGHTPITTNLVHTIGITSPRIAEYTRFRIDEFSALPDGNIGSLDRARWTEFGFQITDVTGGGQESAFTSYGTENINTIEQFETAVGWVANAGTGGAPTLAADPVNPKQGVASLKFTTNKGAASSRYYNFANKAITDNLDALGAGTATDEDIIHIWLKTDRPDKVEEIRIYFVIDSVFATNRLPGTHPTDNTEAYVKTIRPSDFATVIVGDTSTVAASVTAAANLSTGQQLKGKKEKRKNAKLQNAQLEQSRWTAIQMMLGTSWQELGVIAYPLHRGEFRRIGSDASRDWSTVTGIVLAVQVSDSTTGINVWFDDLYLTGGAGLDSSYFGMEPYDYRVTNYNIVSKSEGNPSGVQGPGYRLDSLRRSIVITPPVQNSGFSVTPSAQPNFRQRVYRRGGSLVTNWYFVGENTADGQPFTDIFTDEQIVGNGILQQDNDFPVTTVDSNGRLITSLRYVDTGAQITGNLVQNFFGPVSGIFFACGDPFRKGRIYWTKPNTIDAWPAVNTLQVCPDTEELMAGCVLNGNGFVFSRERMYAVVPNTSDTRAVMTIPTGCAHGLVGRAALCVAYGAIWFVSKDGMYTTMGGSEISVTEELLRPLFHPDLSAGISFSARNGYYPIDFDHPEVIRLEAHDNEIWLVFQDVNGELQTWIFNIISKYWRNYQFSPQASCYHSDTTGEPRLYVGTLNSGDAWIHTGTADNTSLIPADFRTGAMDQEQPRQDKLYGDVVLDMLRNDNQVEVRTFFDWVSSPGPVTTIVTGTGRQRYYAETATYANGSARLSRDIAIQVAWSTNATPPVIFRLGTSVAPQTDTTTKRVTDWESGGRLSDKYVKGVIFECDTNNNISSVEILGDGVVQATVSIQANGRQVVERSFPQFRARLLRIRPFGTTEWKLYDYRWIFDQEPLALARWETQEITHGIPAWQSPLYMHLALRSTQTVAFTLTAYRQDGTTSVKNYNITSTAGEKIKRFLQLEAQKGIMFKYLFTSAEPFWLYRDETEVAINPWGGNTIMAKPFGNDDLDLTRSLNDAGFIAARSGWSLGNNPKQAPNSPDGAELQEG